MDNIHKSNNKKMYWWQSRKDDALMVLAIFLLLTGYSFSAQAIESKALSMSMNQVESGRLLFKSTQTKSAQANNNPIKYYPATLLSEDVDIVVSGLIVTARLKQQFKNDTNDWLEAIYAFPLPENSALYLMEMKIVERVITGEIKEKSQAKRIYQQAKKAGKKASLVEQHRPNLFTNNIANIPPGETVEIILEYNQVVDYQQGIFELRFPLTTTPRYFPGQKISGQEIAIDTSTGWALPTDQVPDAHLISPLTIPSASMAKPSHKVRLSAEINAGFPVVAINSISHAIVVQSEERRNQNTYKVSLKEGEAAMDRDFVLAWEAQTGASPKAALFTETWKGEQYSLLMVMPPQQLSGDMTLPREQVFVIDTSGSMGGESIRQARTALDKALNSLKPSDRFNVIEFNSTTHSLYSSSVPANSRNINHALNYVRSLNADGGTEMASALHAALSGNVYPGYLRQVVFITDGSVGNESALFKQIEQELGESRLFTIGIGSAPNSYFMKKAAEMGRGSFTYISDLNEVERKLEGLFKKLSAPVLSDLSLSAGLDSENEPFESYPSLAGDLYLGEPVIQVIKHKAQEGEQNKQTENLKLTANSIGLHHSNTPLWEQAINIAGAKQAKGIATFWGRQKIESLMDAQNLGTTNTEQVRQQVLDVALKHHLVSPYTSLVAVEKIISRPVESILRKDAVPQLLPKGSSSRMAHFPQTATSSRLYVLLGLICYMIGIGMLYQHRSTASFKELCDD